MATGVVARFDIRRGYGFVIPDDGGEDVFVHQNNIEMEGFRYLQSGEHVSYELEVGEKGMKAVQVRLLDPRPPGQQPFRNDQDRDRDRDRGPRPDRGSYRDQRGDRPARGGGREASAEVERLVAQVDKLRRKQERLISLLVEKGSLAPGEIDGVSAAETDADEAGRADVDTDPAYAD